MSERKHREPRTSSMHYSLLMHVVDSLPPGIDKAELRDNEGPRILFVILRLTCAPSRQTHERMPQF